MAAFRLIEIDKGSKVCSEFYVNEIRNKFTPKLLLVIKHVDTFCLFIYQSS